MRSYADTAPTFTWKTIAGLALLALAVLFSVTTVGCTIVPPGYVGVKVDQWGTGRGVNDLVAQTGAVWYWRPRTDVMVFPVFTQRVVYDNKADEPAEAIDFRSSDKATLVADVAMNFNLKPEKVPHIYVTFRQDLDVLERGIIRDRLRSNFQKYGPTHSTMDLLGQGQTDLEEEVLKAVRLDLEPHGIHIDNVQIISKPRIDQQVESSITALLTSIQQTRTAEQQVKQVEAEAHQKIAAAEGEKRAAIIAAEAAAQVKLLAAEAEAKANRMVNDSITERQIQVESIRRWNGTLPTMVGGNQPIPFLQVK